jgi:ABC-type multidrug transport system fused ATPase/permease subunit
VADGLLLTGKERARLFWLKLAGGAGPSLILVAIAAALGSGAVAYSMAVFAVLIGFVIATTAKKPRGALIGGIVLVAVLLVFQIVVAWFVTHPIEKQ